MDFMENIKAIFPSNEEIFEWIEGLCRLPHRRTGSKEGYEAALYVKRQFEKLKLEDVQFEETDAEIFEIGDYSLNISGEDISCFMINGTLHPEKFGEFEAEINSEIVYLKEGREEDFESVDVRGKIVLCDCPWFEADEDTYASSWCESEAIIYDPDKEQRSKLRKTDSYSPNAWPYNYIWAQKRGAAGFVGILNDYFADGVNWNEDYSELAVSQGCGSFALPGLWIGTAAFNEVKQLLIKGSAPASLTLKTSYQKGIARNVLGKLPGKSKDIIIVHSHYDAVFNGAVQDASGMSEVLALARFFAQIPKEERQKTIIFAGLDGHYTDYAGHQAFITNRLQEGNRIVCDVVLEHIGKEVGLDEYNEPVVTDEAEIRLLYVTRTDGMVDMVHALIEKNDIRRTVILPVHLVETQSDGPYEFSQDEVISDAYYSYINGVPIVSILSPQMYLFHPMDTPEMVVKEALQPIGMTFAELIYTLMEK